MKMIASVVALGLAAAYPTAARSADIYTPGGGGLKDGPAPVSYNKNHTGLGFRVFMGYSVGDRDITQRNSAEAGFRDTPECEAEEEGGEVETSSYKPSCEEVNEDATALAKYFKDAGIDASWNGTTFELPLLRALSAIAGSEDISSFSGGAELEYLWYSGSAPGSFAIGLVGGVQFYADADSHSAYSGNPVTLGGGTLLVPHGSALEGADTGLTTSGFVDVKRDLDVDLALKVGTLITQDTLLYAIAGPSFAKGSVKAGVSVDGIPDAALTYKDDQWAVGYVVGLGIQHYLGNGWSANLQGDYRAHNFDASKTIEAAQQLGDSTAELYGRVKSSTEVDDGIYTIKAGIARHW